MSQSNIVSLDSKYNPTSNDGAAAQTTLNAQVVRDIKRITDNKLNTLIKEMFSNVDDFLFELAEKAETNDKQVAYFDAMRIVRLRRETIEKNYKNYVDATFNNGMMIPISTLSPDTITTPDLLEPLSELDLLNNDELEQNLAITNMVEKARTKAHRELYALAQRFNFLLSTDRFTIDEHPLCLARLCYAFRDAISVFEDETTIEIRLIIFKLFDRFVLSGMPELYNEINQIFISANILPVIKNNILRSASERQTNKENNTEYLEESCLNQPENTTGDIHQHNETFRQLQSLLSDWDKGVVTETEKKALSTQQHNREITLPSIMTALSALQNQTGAQVDNNSPIILDAITIQYAIKQQLINIHQDDDTNPTLNQDNKDTINIIEMLFEFILDDPSLDIEMKAMLARLQIPMLKVSIIDKQFFSKNTHPARRLLNELAKASIGWSKDESTQDDLVYQQVRTTIHRVLTEFDNDIALFDSILEEFCNFISQNEMQEQHAQQQLETIKAEVKTLIENRISKNSSPSIINHFLRFRWSEVLCAVRPATPENNVGWQESIEIMDELLWSIQPKTNQTERKLLTVLIPQLINNITNKLNLSGTNQEELDTFLESLTLLHIASLKTTPNLKHKNTLKETIEQLELNQNKEETALPAENSQLMNAMRMVSEIAIGTWVEFEKEDNSKVRGKLVWKDDYFDSFTFVNRRFKVVSDHNQRDMAKLFMDNKALIIDNVPLLDRALDSIIGKLSQK